MRISSKTVNGLIALIDMCVYAADELATARGVAERQGLSVKYLEQTFPLLKKAGIVKSTLGASGGYVLSKDAKEIKINEVLEALEGDLSTIADKSGESVMSSCLQKHLWDVVDGQVLKALSNITLQELADRYKDENESDNLMFYI